MYYGNNIGRRSAADHISLVVNLLKLVAYCCENFRQCGPEDDGPVRAARPVLISNAECGSARNGSEFQCIILLLLFVK